MSWLLLGLMSACILGLYEVAKKAALLENSVIGVLVTSSWCGLALVIACAALSRLAPAQAAAWGLLLEPLSLEQHALVFGKAALVCASWIATYFALKHLPLSLAGPLRASSPIYTLLGAMLLFGERPTPRQSLGIACILGSYLAYSILGKRADVALAKSRWAALLVVGTLLGAASSLYDKHLLGPSVAVPPWTLQFWFTAYHTVVLSLLGLLLWPRLKKSGSSLELRWAIPMIALALLLADQLYFRALAAEDSLVAVVSLLRRASVLVSFAVGGWLFREPSLGQKGLALAGVALGVVLLVL